MKKSVPYDPSWDLRSIPFRAIPDKLLRAWWAERCRSMRQAVHQPVCGHKSIQKDCPVCRQRQYRRQRRAAGKDLWGNRD